jgi:hypothetical protein
MVEFFRFSNLKVLTNADPGQSTNEYPKCYFSSQTTKILLFLSFLFYFTFSRLENHVRMSKAGRGWKGQAPHLSIHAISPEVFFFVPLAKLYQIVFLSQKEFSCKYFSMFSKKESYFPFTEW